MLGCSFSSVMSWSGGQGLPGSILIMLLSGVLAFYCCTVFKRNNDRRESLEILKKRLATGNISEEEFVKLKQYL